MLDREIIKLITEQGKFQGVDTRKLPKGTKFLVKTKNTEYLIENIDQGGSVLISGGRWTSPTQVKFVGSTFGGSMIRIGWISYHMRMEFYIGDNRVITTSSVQGVKIITPAWEYEMEYPKDISENKVK